MLHVPVLPNVKAPPAVIVQTPVVDDVKVTVKPELADAMSVGAVPKL